ncbi:fruit bromelain-like [Hyposmocoma kahamanoa]|uniref:fruit bromelain-like n=1 Tax=Hyposmocoma kahamanoa TaxID=1477025 RepID=UPI000E6D7F6E|nr:fruit bromelain-like [Hyposmocoma kahamanoa]
MKSLILILLTGIVVVLCKKGIVYDMEKIDELFEKFIKDYDRVYKDDEDRKIHFEAFKVNVERLNKRNDEDDAIFGIDKFADYTKEEWDSMQGVPADAVTVPPLE